MRLVTDKMLFNSVTLRLAEMTSQAFLSPRIFTLFQDGLAAVLGVAKEQILVFNVQVSIFGSFLIALLLWLVGVGKEVPPD